MKYLTWAEINLGDLKHNLDQIRARVGPSVKILAPVKANAYGHGAVEIARSLQTEGVDMFAVARLSEAQELSAAGIRKPILIFAALPPGLAEEAAADGFRVTLCSDESAEALCRWAEIAGSSARVHVKVDTGMGRIGVPVDRAAAFVKRVHRMPGIEIEGIYTHFPSADEDDRSFTLKQIELFEGLLSELKREGIDIPIRHAANSAGADRFPGSYLTMVRPGLALYGLHPDAETLFGLDLRPILTLKTRVMFLKDIPPGASVSYGRRFIARRTTRAASLPIGYADGLSRSLSNRGHVLVGGRRAPIIGTICMDQCVADVTDIPGVSLNDEVVVYGSQGDERISIESVAQMLGTISYEVASTISRRVHRVYVR